MSIKISKKIQKNIGLVIALILVILFAVALPYLMLFKPASIFAVSKIELDQQGYEDSTTHEWRGSFWHIVGTTTTTEDVLFYQFDKAESEKPYSDNEVEGVTLEPQAIIKTTVTSKTPYYLRALEDKAYRVYPETFQTHYNSRHYDMYKTASYIEPFDVSVKEFGTGSWEIHIPFTIEVEKTVGDNTFTEIKEIDLIGPAASLPITIVNPNDEAELLYMQLEGQLGTGYEIGLPDVLMFSEDVAFTHSDDLVNKIRYDIDYNSYSNYWFGGGSYKARATGDFPVTPDTPYSDEYYEVKRWEDKSPKPYVDSGTEAGIIPKERPKGIYWKDVPGWSIETYGYSTSFYYTPIEADIWNDNLDTKPVGKSLINYLLSMYSKLNLDIWGSGYEITDDNKLKINLPIGSFSWLYTLRISTELADSIVVQPIVGKGEIVNLVWEKNQEKLIDIPDREKASLEVKCTEGSGRLTVVPSFDSTLPAEIIPTSDAYIFDSNETHEFIFEILNLGTEVDAPGAVSFDVVNDLGTVTDAETLDFVLKPKGGAVTTLTIYMQDSSDTSTRISGVYTTVAWDTESKSGVSGSGGAVTFDLGSYEGSVAINTLPITFNNVKYKAGYGTTGVTIGYNEYYMSIEREIPPENGKEDYTLWMLGGLGLTTAIISTFVIHKYRYKIKGFGIKKK